MPKIYEHKGYSFFFYSNEHEPPHCHVKKDGKEVKVTFVNTEGAISLKYKWTKTGKQFAPREIRSIDDFARTHCNDILNKWNIFFNEKGHPKFEKISTPKRKAR